MQDEPGTWQICDLNSSNGTYINNERLYQCHTLVHGDLISLGRHGPQFIFEVRSAHSISSLSIPEPTASALTLTTQASKSRSLSHSHASKSARSRSPSRSFSKTGSTTGAVTLSQLFPILSTGRDLAQKAYLIPGIVTVSFVVLMFAAVGKPEWFNLLLAAYLSGAAYYFVYQLCGKRKPWWLIVLAASITATLLLSPILNGFLWFFRGVLPGQIPSNTDSIHTATLLVQMFFGAGLMEELIKAVPVLLAYGVGRLLSSPQRERVGVWEPLDGILLGTASAIGFTLVETLGQYVPAVINSVTLQAGSSPADLVGLQLLIPRILGSVSGHMAYSGYLGYFIGLSVLKPRHRWQILGIGYLSAALLHALWNVTGFLNPLSLALIGVLSYAFLTAAILKARTLSPTRSQNFATRFTNKSS
jgi:RsiW-degrading membrane proteinase PrsW (M82 family)